MQDVYNHTRICRTFEDEKYASHPNLTSEGLDEMMASEFVEWFEIAVSTF